MTDGEHTALRAVMYLRLSKEGEAPIERQREDCTTLIAARGWDLTGEYVDNVSAFRSEVIRPGYTEMVDRIAEGAIDVVVVYHRDRLWRQTTDQASFTNVAKKAGLALVVSVSEGDIDPASSTDKFINTILTAHAEMSSEDTRRRVTRAAFATAKQGRPNGGGHRAFGYERDGVTVVPAEAALIRAAVADMLDGRALSAVVGQWNAAGVRTTTGGPWRRQALRNLLLRPRIAGIRQYHDAEMAPAVWPAVVDEKDWRRLVELLTAGTWLSGSEPAALLSGIAICGRCGAPLGTEPPRLRPDGRRMVDRLYACRAVTEGGCRSLTIRAGRADAVVVARLFEAIDSGALERSLTQRQRALAGASSRALVSGLDADRRALADLQHDFYVRHTLSRGLFLETEAALLGAIARAEQRLDAGPAGLGMLSGGGVARLRRAWETRGEDLRWRRAVLRSVFARVVIAPSATGGGRKFDESRVVTDLV